MTTLDSFIETEIRDTEAFKFGDDVGTYDPSGDQTGVVRDEDHTDVPAVDVVVDIDIDIDVDAIAVVDVDIDIDIDVDTPHIDQD